MLQKIRNRKGFTLVELMIVVAIIGILAAIAIPNFLQFRLKAKTSEAKSNLGAIRSTEVAYFAEWNWYIGNQGVTPGHAGNLAGSKVPWANGTRFSIIGFAPEGAVYYDYELVGSAFAAGTVADGLDHECRRRPRRRHRDEHLLPQHHHQRDQEKPGRRRRLLEIGGRSPTQRRSDSRVQQMRGGPGRAGPPRSFLFSDDPGGT